MGKGKKIVLGIAIGITIAIILYVLIVQMAWQEQREMLEGKVVCSDGSIVPQECATLCGMPSLQICIDDLNRPIPKTPSESTMGWFEEQKEFNEELIKNPTPKNCDLAERNIIAIQETVDRLPEGDANAEIYIQGINLYENSISEHCK